MLFYGISLIMKEKSNASALIWDEARPNLGADTLESAPRCARLWEQMRLRLGRRTLISLREGLAARQGGIGARGEQMRPRKRYACKNNGSQAGVQS